MDFKKVKAETTTITRDLADFSEGTNNVYETVVIISKRANQIASDMKEELKKKLEEFGDSNDALEEKFENQEQIQISKFYERLPKPSLIATQEYLDGKIHWRNPKQDTGDNY
ncbi:MAG: DNA-directed RNA polymerase subunit omega [Bacteroidaceae bacterium]|jgi:DNA-directed RNA polymerase subunit K/omega|nr:DNA-directed RNA polymerase subunit omega [Bacteroidaceae bacterium]